MKINTHNMIVEFGKHRGELWTRVPREYLTWLVNQPDVIVGMEDNKDIAQAELERRGTKVSSEVERSKHAIDKASLRARKVWHETAIDENEGLYTWLSRIANEAVSKTEGKPERINHLGLTLIFKWGNIYPVLKTVINKR